MRRRRVYTRQPHLWRRENGVFYIVWNEEGRTRKVSTKTSKRALADEALRAFLDGPREPEEPAPERLMFADGVAEWLADRQRPRHGLSPRTVRDYERWARLFATSFPEGLAAAEVTPRHIRSFLDAQEDRGLSPSSLRKLLVGLSMVFRFLMREGVVERNPCEHISVKTSRSRQPDMTDEEFRQLTGVMDEEIKTALSDEERRDAQELRDLADVLWWSGLRFVEAMRLTWDAIDLEAGTWEIRSPENKGGTTTLPFHPCLRPILDRRRHLGLEGPFRSYWAVSRLWRRFKTRHPEFDGWGWHRMRHAFVTRLRRSGRETAAMLLARHKTHSMSLHYTHLTAADLRDDLEAL